MEGGKTRKMWYTPGALIMLEIILYFEQDSGLCHLLLLRCFPDLHTPIIKIPIPNSEMTLAK